jgi:NitT/TauT family transport system permease protein
VIGLALGFGASPVRSLSHFWLRYTQSQITLYPVILLLFGLGVSAKIAFGAIHGLFRRAVAMNAVRSIRGVHLRAARASPPPQSRFTF